MKLCITRQTLSPNCRHRIIDLFKTKGIDCDAHGLMNAVDKLLAGFKLCGHTKKVDAKHVRQDLHALIKTLNGLTRDTRRLLSEMYLQAYRLPTSSGEFVAGKVNEFLVRRVLSQTQHTHYIRIDERGIMGLPVPLDELIARVLRTCDLVEQHYHASSGAPVDGNSVIFVMYMLHAFERFTGTKATASPRAVFDLFLDLVFVDMTGAEAGMSRRKLITAAMAERNTLSPVDEELVRLSQLLPKRGKNTKARRRLMTVVPPARATYLETLLSFLGKSGQVGQHDAASRPSSCRSPYQRK